MRFAKKCGVHPDQVKIKETASSNSQIEAQLVRISADNNPFILEAIKISYEFAANFFSEYLHDPLAVVYAGILHSGSFNYDYRRYYESNQELNTILQELFPAFFGLPRQIHAVLLASVQGYGLICIVKIFEFTLAIVLSEFTHYLQAQPLLVINDPLQDIWAMNATLSLVSFQIKTMELSTDDAIVFEQAAAEGGFQLEDGRVPVYCEDGSQLFESIVQIASIAKEKIKDGYLLEGNQVKTTYVLQRKVFLKLHKAEKYCPLREVKFVCRLNY